jgi:dienelactone hydrolase
MLPNLSYRANVEELGRYCYNKAAAERHWERLFALFGPALATAERKP